MLFSALYLFGLIFAGARLAHGFAQRKRLTSSLSGGVGGLFVWFGAKLAAREPELGASESSHPEFIEEKVNSPEATSSRHPKTYRYPKHPHHWRWPHRHWPGLPVDYSGVQACKALREEGYKVILINSNPATIMTDPATANVTYIEPITWQTVEKITQRRQPGCDFAHHGWPDRAELCSGPVAQRRSRQVHRHSYRETGKLIGATPEDRQGKNKLKFKDAMTKIGLGSARSGIAHGVGRGIGNQNCGVSNRHSPQFHIGWNRRRYCLQPRRV